MTLAVVFNFPIPLLFISLRRRVRSKADSIVEVPDQESVVCVLGNNVQSAQSSSGLCIHKVNSMTTLDTIANLKPIARDRLTLVEPEYKLIEALPIGQVGTILEVYPGESLCYLVEFADLQGWEYAMAVLQPDEILALYYELSLAS
jgi:Domain of unknown function (DUF4926)